MRKRKSALKIQSWDRVRFYADESDYRPVKFPPPGPYWCSGYGSDYSVIVAYIPHGMSDAKLKRYWPEGHQIERMQCDVQITFSDRFPKPTWWKKPAFFTKWRKSNEGSEK